MTRITRLLSVTVLVEMTKKVAKVPPAQVLLHHNPKEVVASRDGSQQSALLKVRHGSTCRLQSNTNNRQFRRESEREPETLEITYQVVAGLEQVSRDFAIPRPAQVEQRGISSEQCRARSCAEHRVVVCCASVVGLSG
jgi:hypothetical protein